MNLTKLNERTIKELRKIFGEISSEKTAYDAKVYSENKSKTPVYGHCGCIATVIKDVYGGSILKGEAIPGHNHYWNQLPDGTAIDLTSDQYGGDGLNPVVKDKYRKHHFRNKNKRFAEFKELFLKKVEEKKHVLEIGSGKD